MRGNTQRDKIKTYRNNLQINSLSDLPVPFAQRASTDICCTIATSIFAVAMFVVACVGFNAKKLAETTYPTDAIGRKCTLDNPVFNYLYFTTPNDPSKRLCVSQCPTGNQSRLQCLPTSSLSCSKNNNPDYQVQIYASTAQQTSIGLYCFPTDESLKQKILENANLSDRFNFIKSFRSIWISAAIAFGLAAVFLLMNCCMTQIMVYISILLGGLSFIGISVLLVLANTKYKIEDIFSEFKYYTIFLYILAVVMLVIGLMLVSSVCFKSGDLVLCGQYLYEAVLVLRKQLTLYILIPIFLALTAGLIFLCYFQLSSYYSYSSLTLPPNQVYYSPMGTFPYIMQILQLAQFLWGLCFLKQAFNYIVSGCGVTNSFIGDSFIMEGVKSLFRFHWGSVVAASFLLNFFYLADLVYDFFKPSQANRGCYRCFVGVCCLCDRVLGFARSETMAFINAVGLPYCNSSRWCQRINYLSSYFDGSQSIFRYFSLGSHTLLAGSATALGFIGQSQSAHQLVLLFSFGLNLFVVTYFVSLLNNLAESILLCKLIEGYIKGENLYPEDGVDQVKDIQESHVNQGYEIMKTRE